MMFDSLSLIWMQGKTRGVSNWHFKEPNIHETDRDPCTVKQREEDIYIYRCKSSVLKHGGFSPSQCEKAHAYI